MTKTKIPNKKFLKDVGKAFETEGFKILNIEQKKSHAHWQLSHRDYTFTIVSAISPSCHHALKNCVMEARRIAKKLDKNYD